MICGVQGGFQFRDSCIATLNDGLQGDFTRSLVNDPPKTLWTRQLKVSGFVVTATYSGRIETPL